MKWKWSVHVGQILKRLPCRLDFLFWSMITGLTRWWKGEEKKGAI